MSDAMEELEAIRKKIAAENPDVDLEAMREDSKEAWSSIDDDAF